MNHLSSANETLKLYTQAIERLHQRLSETFNHAVEMILNCQGRVVVAGIGKSGLVGKKWLPHLLLQGHPASFYTRQKPFTEI